MKHLIQKIFNAAGLRISRTKRSKASMPPPIPNPYSHLASQPVIDLEGIASIAETIPGMISSLAGKLLYTLCYFQELKGDVIEVGSWQGRSTSFLARAVQNSKGGSFYAIDHFKGNPGKQNRYVIGSEDLSDLQKGFEDNIKRAGVADVVNLLNMPNDVAIKELEGKKVRFLFIDGNHTYDGVRKDIELFFPLLIKGAIVVFDDYVEEFPGVIRAVNELLEGGKAEKAMCYRRTIALKVF